MRSTWIVASVAALAVVPIGLAARNQAPQPGDLDVITLNGGPCGLAGAAKSEINKDLCRHKNRYLLPDESDIDPEVSLAAMTTPGKDYTRFDAEKAARINAFVVRVMPGGHREDCNCKSTKEDEIDTHIEVAMSPGALENQRVIVEVTPRMRIVMKGQGKDWSTDALKAEIEGKWVEFTGWLLFDSMHVKQAENTNPGDPKNWRVTCWEIHPVTGIKVLDTPPTGAGEVTPAALTALHRWHAAHVVQNPAGKKALAREQHRYLSKFDPEELKEAEEETAARAKK